jgi:hypothetical protein
MRTANADADDFAQGRHLVNHDAEDPVGNGAGNRANSKRREAASSSFSTWTTAIASHILER